VRRAREAAERARARERAAADALAALRRGCFRDGYDEAGVARIDEATGRLRRGSLTATEAEQAVGAARRRAETRERLEWVWAGAVGALAFDAIAFLRIRTRFHGGALDEEEAERAASLIAERAVGSAVRGGLRRVK